MTCTSRNSEPSPSFPFKWEDFDFLMDRWTDVQWASLSNGDLLYEAEKEFEVFLTSDKILSFQQSIPSSSIHVVLLKAMTNTYKDLLPLIEKLAPIVKNHEPVKFVEID